MPLPKPGHRVILSENAEYEVAKDRQGFIEGRIQEVEGKLSACQIIDPAGAPR